MCIIKTTIDVLITRHSKLSEKKYIIHGGGHNNVTASYQCSSRGLSSELPFALGLGGCQSVVTETAAMKRRTAELPKFPNPRVDLYFGPPPQLPPHVVWPSGAVEPQGKVSKCFIIDFLTITDPFFTIIGYSLLIYANGMISRAPLLTALHFRSYPRSLFIAILNADGTLSSGEGIISDNVISDLFAPPQPPSSMTTWLTP